jgi:signal transduction histidine kinase/CheY-like chemotaxis protein
VGLAGDGKKLIMATILVVDDDESARDLVVTVLGYAGHQLQEASDGAEALSRAKSRPPDLVIADLMMPTMDGFEFVRQLRESQGLAFTPVMFYTATYLESEARNLASACGVTQIITKPAEPQQILDAVEKSLGAPPMRVVASPSEEFHQKHLGLLLSKLYQKAESMGPRLDAMIELGLHFASERDPQRLLSEFCVAARKIIGAKYTVVGVADRANGKLRCQFASGMTREKTAALTLPPTFLELPADLVSAGEPRRLRGLPGDPLAVGLPGEHPPVHSFLCAPIHSPDRTYGWLCLSDKIGSAEFNEEDEGLAQILAAQVGRIYENGSIYAQLEESVARLETEVAERKRAQEQIDRLNSELEERVRQRTAELESAIHELEAFSYSVSHDLRAPLRAMGGFARIVSREYASLLPPEGQVELQRISDNAGKMGQLIEGLLDFSRLSRQPLAKRSVHPNEIVQSALTELHAEQAGRRVEMTIEELPDCQADPALLQQVYVNLLSNALKYTRRCDSAVIKVGSRKENDETVYFVQDNGAGFDMKFADKLFRVFQRLHTPDQFDGVGAGLAIMHRIIQRHGGRVWAQAEVDRGATFFFTLEEQRPK